MSKLSETLRRIADANKACDLLDKILELKYIPIPVEDIYALKNEIERVKVEYTEEIHEIENI